MFLVDDLLLQIVVCRQQPVATVPVAMRSVRPDVWEVLGVFPRAKEPLADVQEILFLIGLIGVVVLESSLNRT